MILAPGRPEKKPWVRLGPRVYEGSSFALGLVMFLSFILSLMARHAAFSWQPELDLADSEIFSTLLPSSRS